MAKIENHKYTIEEAFRDCFYIIPDYQREYVWTEKEVNKLLDDINDEIDGASSSEYFIGTILTSPTQLKNHIEVIDGQQRLTTLFLILCALRSLFGQEPQSQILSSLISTSYSTNDGDVKTSLKLDPRYEDAGEFVSKIVQINGDPDATKSSIVSLGLKEYGALENILNAYRIIYRYLQANYKDTGSLKKYWGYLANNVVFIQISTDVSSALKIFETINERGVGLNPMDLLKNLLFTQVKQEDFTKLKDEWKKITKPLEEANEKPLRFLRYFLMANYKIESKNKDNIVREDEIYDWFTNKNNVALCKYTEEPFAFVRKIIKNVNSYLGFAKGLGNDGTFNLNMDTLKRLCGGAFSLHYVLLLPAANLPKELFDHFVNQLETLLFYHIFTKAQSKEVEKSFSVWADELREIALIEDAHTQKVKLNNFITERFEKSVASKKTELFDDLKRYTFYSMQQYRSRYLLAKLTQHVDMAYLGTKTPGSLEDYVKLEIEHILPNTPNQELLDEFKASSPEVLYDDYKVKLGNLTLLEKPINIVAGRKFFEDKKSEYKKSKNYLTSSIAELTFVGNDSSINRIGRKLGSFEKWDHESIDRRQDILIGLVDDVWRVQQMEVS
ncbi:MAG: DUF262 domain-containing protein [Desulfuromusa sp.]